MSPPKQKVLDRLLLMELVADKDEALAQVLSGNVVSDKKRFSSLHDWVEADDVLRLKTPKRQYVSRGGEKLASVFGDFGLPMEHLVGLDAGASTGGFTDFCLQQGAAGMISVDVSYGMLAHSLRIDPRVVAVERTNIRKLSANKLNTLLTKLQKHAPAPLQAPVDFIVGDLSFISIRQVLPSLLNFLKPGGWMILLIKPQFEARSEQIPEGGVILDPALREQIVDSVEDSAKHLPLETLGIIPSGLTGREGNQEYFWGIKSLKY